MNIYNAVTSAPILENVSMEKALEFLAQEVQKDRSSYDPVVADYLDDLFPPAKVLNKDYPVSEVLKVVDPDRYDLLFNEWVDQELECLKDRVLAEDTSTEINWFDYVIETP